MLLIFGSTMYGRVYKVRGRFCVATEFVHIYYVPIAPINSFLVSNERYGEADCVRIPMSWKSVLTAWGRLVTGATAIIAGPMLYRRMGAGLPASQWAELGLWFAAAAGFFIYSHTPWYTRASPARALALAERAAARPAPKAAVPAYGAAPRRGFEVMAAPMPAVATVAEREFRLFGVGRADGQERTYLVWAVDEAAARARGEEFGIRVDRAEPAGQTS